ncbi:MarR family transcriptional regulator [uncultured Cohaesibacter sp.]|uniref:MarR family winged helix-turn-helix transcriptional regulator n=1 Tax=uncultured Cohaesibacter sp. TaxID=1002546 RepID=UPI0029C755E9|nr:MarR family transcriptional regulator [uncultured Cohaesibacter sp.]
MNELEDRLTKDFLESLTTLSRRLKTRFDARVTAHGLTFARGRALMLLVRTPDITQKELACKLGLEQATVVRLLDRMEEHDLIRRIPDENDRRVKKIHLTEQGEAGGQLVKSIGEAIRQEVFGDIPIKDLEVAIAVLQSASASMDENSD